MDDLFSGQLSSSLGRIIINIGAGWDLAIRDLAELVAKAVGFRGRVEWDSTKPDGTPAKLLDIKRLSDMGWEAKIPLEEGLRTTYEDYLKTSNAR